PIRAGAAAVTARVTTAATIAPAIAAGPDATGSSARRASAEPNDERAARARSAADHPINRMPTAVAVRVLMREPQAISAAAQAARTASVPNATPQATHAARSPGNRKAARLPATAPTTAPT